MILAGAHQALDPAYKIPLTGNSLNVPFRQQLFIGHLGGASADLYIFCKLSCRRETGRRANISLFDFFFDVAVNLAVIGQPRLIF